MYGKIFEQMYDSTVAEDWRAMVTFQQLIVLADRKGFIDRTPQAISRRTNIPLEIIQAGLEALERPDPSSRSQEEGGARIIRIDEHREWGWRIVNYESYRAMVNEEQQRCATAERQRRFRANQASRSVTPSNGASQETPEMSRHADAEAELDADISKPIGLPSPQRVPFSQIVQIYRVKCVPPMPDVLEMTEARKAQLKARWQKHPELSFWEDYFAKAAASDFLTGRRETQRGPFFASFDWLISPKNYAKVLEGNYDNREGESGLDALIKKSRREESAMAAERNHAFGKGVLGG